MIRLVETIQSKLEQRTPVLCTVIIALCLVMIPFKIIGYGYLSQDDALRHVAKAVSGKSWQEILVLNDSYSIDQHAGWHRFLEFLHHNLGLGTEGLFIFSFVLLFCVLSLSALPFLKRPEVWVIAMLAVYLAEIGSAMRWFMNRPLIVSMAALIVLLLMWRDSNRRKPPLHMILISTAVMTISVWMHGSYYLLLIPVAGFFLARKWYSVMWLTGCWIVGTILGACLTGDPIGLLTEVIMCLYLSLGEQLPQKILVTEFRSNTGSFSILILVFSIILLRISTGSWRKSIIDNPAFYVMAIGWLLGFKVIRFWQDWGMPAMMVWTTVTLSELWQTHIKSTSLTRLSTTLFACAALFLATTSDVEQRWSWKKFQTFIDKNDPSMAEWLPGDQGVVYSSDMVHFYQTFFTFPQGNWRYSTGFEPGVMEPENRKVYLNIRWNDDDFRAFAPWVRKLRPQDRLFMNGPEGAHPPIPTLEWKYAASNLWVGRIPTSRPAATAE